jgi:hypothetical protein
MLDRHGPWIARRASLSRRSDKERRMDSQTSMHCALAWREPEFPSVEFALCDPAQMINRSMAGEPARAVSGRH